MKTGLLTPRTNNTIRAKRYTGGFGQSNGFGSVLRVDVRQDGRLNLCLTYKETINDDSRERTWNCELSNEQRKDLAGWIGEYDPILVEDIPND